MEPFNRDTAREFAIGHPIRRKNGDGRPIVIFGITDFGMFLGDMEGGPFVTYEWALEHAEFLDGKPCGVEP